MNIYKLRYGEGFQWVLPVHDEEIEKLRFDGTPRAGAWTPVAMRVLTRSEKGRALRNCDFPACSGGDMLIMSGAAKAVLGSELLGGHAEFLPLSCDSGEFWAANVTTSIDALDEKASQLLRASDTGVVLVVRKHVFRSEAITGAPIFKLKQTPRGLVYVTDTFVNTVKDAGLLGLEFDRVWLG